MTAEPTPAALGATTLTDMKPKTILGHLMEFSHRYLIFWRCTYDLTLLFYGLTYFIICAYITCLANSQVDRINPNNLVPVNERIVLVDPGLKWLFSQFLNSGLPRDLSDILIRVSVVLIALGVLVCRDYAATVGRRVLYIAGTVYLVRAPTILMTVLPNPYVEVRFMTYVLIS